MALLAEPRRNVAVVGDDDQSIYRFRGAATGAIVDFLERFRGARTIVLRRNYRSRAPILDASYRLIRFNDPDRLEVQQGITKRLVAQRRSGSTGATAARRAAAAPCATSPSAPAPRRPTGSPRRSPPRIAGGAAPRDFAVLVRANADADPVLRSLNLAGVPWRFSGASGLYGAPGDPRAAGVPAGGRRSRQLRRRLRPGGLRRLRHGRRGPRGAGEPGPPDEPLPVGDARRGGAASRASSAFVPTPGRRWRGSSPTCVATASWATGARLAKSYTTSCGHRVHLPG